MATAIITTKYCNANALQSLISDKNERYFWKQKKPAYFRDKSEKRNTSRINDS